MRTFTLLVALNQVHLGELVLFGGARFRLMNDIPALKWNPPDSQMEFMIALLAWLDYYSPDCRQLWDYGSPFLK